MIRSIGSVQLPIIMRRSDRRDCFLAIFESFLAPLFTIDSIFKFKSAIFRDKNEKLRKKLKTTF